MYRRTFEQAVGPGIYHSDCRCRFEIRIRKGDRFPRCPQCECEVGWMFTRSIHANDSHPKAAADVLPPNDDPQRDT